MSGSSAAPAADVAQRLRASNRRTAWTLASIAAVFFAGIIATRWIGAGTAGIGVMGTVVLLFLVVAIGRNLRRSGERTEGRAAPTGASAHEPEPARMDAQRRDAPSPARGPRR